MRRMTSGLETNKAREANKAIVRRLIDGIDRADFSVLERVCSKRLRAHVKGTELDRSQIEAAARQFSKAFPDIRHDIKDMVAEGNRVVVRAMDEATHRSEFRGIPATHKRVRFEMIAIYKISRGRITEIWEQIDTEALLQQLTK